MGVGRKRGRAKPLTPQRAGGVIEDAYGESPPLPCREMTSESVAALVDFVFPQPSGKPHRERRGDILFMVFFIARVAPILVRAKRLSRCAKEGAVLGPK